MLDLIIAILYNFIQVYVYIMFIYILLSWTPLVKSSFYRMLGSICDPYLNLFRGRFIISNMDFGAVIGIVLLQVLLMLLGNLIY